MQLFILLLTLSILALDLYIDANQPIVTTTSTSSPLTTSTTSATTTPQPPAPAPATPSTTTPTPPQAAPANAPTPPTTTTNASTPTTPATPAVTPPVVTPPTTPAATTPPVVASTTTPTSTPSAPTTAATPATPAVTTTTTTTTTSDAPSVPKVDTVVQQILISLYIQNNYEEQAILQQLELILTDQNTPVIKDNLNITIKGSTLYSRGTVTAFDITTQSKNINNFSGLQSITINNNKITFDNIKTGSTLSNPIKITKKNGNWILDK